MIYTNMRVCQFRFLESRERRFEQAVTERQVGDVNRK